MWVATGLMAGYIYLPRATRLAVDTLAVLAGADLLQLGYSQAAQSQKPAQADPSRPRGAEAAASA